MTKIKFQAKIESDYKDECFLSSSNENEEESINNDETDDSDISY